MTSPYSEAEIAQFRTAYLEDHRAYSAALAAQASEAFGQDAKRLDGEATKARSRKGCATQGDE